MSVVVFSHYIYVYHKCSQRLFPEASFNASKNDILINKHMINMKLKSGTDIRNPFNMTDIRTMVKLKVKSGHVNL